MVVMGVLNRGACRLDPLVVVPWTAVVGVVLGLDAYRRNNLVVRVVVVEDSLCYRRGMVAGHGGGDGEEGLRSVDVVRPGEVVVVGTRHTGRQHGENHMEGGTGVEEVDHNELDNQPAVVGSLGMLLEAVVGFAVLTCHPCSNAIDMDRENLCNREGLFRHTDPEPHMHWVALGRMDGPGFRIHSDLFPIQHEDEVGVVEAMHFLGTCFFPCTS